MQLARPQVAFSLTAIKQACDSEDVDPLAVWARTMLISALAQDGGLEKYRREDSFDETVFDVASQFPLPHGLQVFNKEEFLAKLP